MLTERDHRTLRVIGEQSKRLQRQIETLLDVSQIGTNHLSLECRPTDLCQLVERIVDEIQLTLERHQVTCICEGASLIVDGDEARLEQVIQNLLQNAVKYSPDGGTITFHVARQGTEACIAITDQGIGIPAEAQAKLFERFYRAENAASRGILGLGIGLAVVTDIIARHGGRVEVVSVEGQGSTFRVLLPESRARVEPT
jgi:signal transduction histidine kinase